MAELYFLRHGKATDLGSGGSGDDFDRALTSKGIEEIESEARTMHRLGVRPDVILTSPLVRARETAEIVAKRLGLKKALVESDLLRPGCSLQKLRELLDQHTQAKSIMLVGHEPDLSSMVGELVGAGPDSVEMKKGGLALVAVGGAVQRAAGVLQWLAPPRLLLESD